MSKFRDDSNSQRDDIVAFFRSVPGLVFAAVVVGGFGVWLMVQFVLDLIAQGAAG